MLFSYQAFYVLCPVVPFGRYVNAFFLSHFTTEISPICPVVTFVMALLAKYVLLVEKWISIHFNHNYMLLT